MKTYNGQDVNWAQIKRDGNCLLCCKDQFGAVTFKRGRNETTVVDLQWVPSLAGLWTRVPVNTSILGELWYPGRHASYLPTAFKERDPKLRFEGFAIPSMPCDTPLDIIGEKLALWGVPFVPLIRDWDQVQRHVNGREELPPDVEGYVFKNGNMEDHYKWKPVKTIDLVVTGTKDGDGKFLGAVGALICSAWHTSPVPGHWEVVANVSGMDDDLRWSLDEDDVIGRVVEVAYQYVGDKGRLRHPRFVRFRDDKNGEQCTTDQDTNLWEYYK